MCRHMHLSVCVCVCVCAYVHMCHQNLILDSAGRKCLLFALPFRFCGAFFNE